jgi:hypothetical protein
MYNITLENGEFRVFKKTCNTQSHCFDSVFHKNNVEVSFMNYDAADKCFEMIVDDLLYDGYNLSYNPTPKGVLLENIVTKLSLALQ